MCVVIAKYFKDTGWVAVKNRDRNYTPEISFNRVEDASGIERLLFEDDVTKYMEGINSNGVGILSASLMVQNDEKEITKSAKEKSPDGVRIKRALEQGNAFDAARAAAEYELSGNSIIVGLDINAALMKLKNSVASAQKQDLFRRRQWLLKPKTQNK